MTQFVWEGKRVLVTGGAGFVGSQLVKRLLSEGARVLVLDDLYTGREENLPRHSGLDLVIGSVTDEGMVQRVVGQAEVVFHLAARNIIVSTKDPRNDFETNIGGTLNVLLAAKAHPDQVTRVVYASSASVYGNPRYLPINEDDRINILTPYAASKYGGEMYCRAFTENYGIRTAVVRYSNVYGEGQSPANPYCGVVAKFMDAAEHGKPLCIHGDGYQTRDYTYVGDAVEATLRAGSSPQAENQVFNVGTGNETSVLALAQAVSGLYAGIPPIEHVERRDIDNVRRRVLNIEMARSRLRWIPEVPLAKGLELTKKWLAVERAKAVH
jgi:UDP-glucose 4-epimerase